MRPKLPALEKNILKYRALQMVLLLHEVESFRAFLLGSIRETDRLRRLMRTADEDRIPEGTSRPMEKVLALLVREGIVTDAESKDIRKIIDIRNDVGHRVHELVEDISKPGFHALLRSEARYDYSALNRFERHRKKVSAGLARKGFILQIGLREVSFEQAEETYKEELQRLRKRVDRQYRGRQATTKLRPV